MAKMLGRLGWRGQCSCCNGPKDKTAIRKEEKREWMATVNTTRRRTREAIAFGVNEPEQSASRK